MTHTYRVAQKYTNEYKKLNIFRYILKLITQSIFFETSFMMTSLLKLPVIKMINPMFIRHMIFQVRLRGESSIAHQADELRRFVTLVLLVMPEVPLVGELPLARVAREHISFHSKFDI